MIPGSPNNNDDLFCEVCAMTDEESKGEKEEEEEEEGQEPKVVKDPGSPTRDEIDQHNVTHTPFRPWCTCLPAEGRH